MKTIEYNADKTLNDVPVVISSAENEFHRKGNRVKIISTAETRDDGKRYVAENAVATIESDEPGVLGILLENAVESLHIDYRPFKNRAELVNAITGDFE